MEYEYVVAKDDETDDVIFVGRFGKKARTEIWRDGKWHQANSLYSDLHDGLLDDITEAEALQIIGQKMPQLEAA